MTNFNGNTEYYLDDYDGLDVRNLDFSDTAWLLDRYAQGNCSLRQLAREAGLEIDEAWNLMKTRQIELREAKLKRMLNKARRMIDVLRYYVGF